MGNCKTKRCSLFKFTPFSLGYCDRLILVLLMTQSLHRLHASTPVIMLVLSVFSGKGNMLSTPLASVSLSALSPLPYCSWPRGTVAFLNALSPFVSTHWLALCSSKSRAAWGASRSSTSSSSSSTSRSCCCCPPPQKRGKKNRLKRKTGSFSATCQGMSASAAVMRINWVYRSPFLRAPSCC